MKRQLKRGSAHGFILMMVLSICPMEVFAAEMVTPISTAEEFMEIMDRPDGSYRLENDLDLGLIEPLGMLER